MRFCRYLYIPTHARTHARTHPHRLPTHPCYYTPTSTPTPTLVHPHPCTHTHTHIAYSPTHVIIHLASFPGSLGVWREESLVYTVCTCTSSGGMPPAPVTIPYTSVHQLDNELFIQVGITASPSATFDKAASYAPQRLFCPYLRLGPAYGTARGQRSVPFCNVAPHNYTAWVWL